ncbi:unnamed protein product [Lota lota]
MPVVDEVEAKCWAMVVAKVNVDLQKPRQDVQPEEEAEPREVVGAPLWESKRWLVDEQLMRRRDALGQAFLERGSPVAILTLRHCEEKRGSQRSDVDRFGFRYGEQEGHDEVEKCVGGTRCGGEEEAAVSGRGQGTGIHGDLADYNVFPMRLTSLTSLNSPSFTSYGDEPETEELQDLKNLFLMSGRWVTDDAHLFSDLDFLSADHRGRRAGATACPLKRERDRADPTLTVLIQRSGEGGAMQRDGQVLLIQQEYHPSDEQTLADDGAHLLLALLKMVSCFCSSRSTLWYTCGALTR